MKNMVFEFSAVKVVI